ncbi:acyl-CoA dehydrogenase family protein [Streptomyces clavuligerus]|uniref:Acyl-coa dehydrogenase protein n=1 Tax=Streptomyces clavuligerus TaxID=1901 RepID=E2Q757_STRCL|nr:acyl-CoA dehydrogenase family protein [Streptomyces clavuligerus]ANW21529.1 acyl-CoA dehydrogenase [Streptomyces clavuligerus]AXU16160.1 acyl-CoA dehydrogenase [Streptomyces clavuligerus]EFG05304.1 Acyl-coa dehydrogenase protein [Streptomyces clavuligerus]MBY6306308.1 acyl-CoA/acyl-ACP dehydrogenase [Streptomyces clavuligerus]QCS08939.1 acyl-CoA dehydrogenase [Streptomyces clavuligerus]
MSTTTEDTQESGHPADSAAPRLPLLDSGWNTSWTVPPARAGATGPERIRDLADSGYAALAVPRELGGAGEGLVGVAAAQRALGRVDPSAAIALNMHAFTVGLLADYWRRHRDTSWMLLEGIAGSGALVASAFAEPGGSPNFTASRSEAVPTTTGYRVTGVKFPCSLATTATLVCLTARVTGTEETILALVPRSSPGMEVRGEWASLGMTDSDTARLVLDDVAVDDRLVFHRGPADVVDENVIAGMSWFAVLLTATYHGVLSGLLDTAYEQTARTGAFGPRTALLGRATRELLTLGGACRQLGTDIESGTLGGPAALAAAMGLRASLSDTRDRVLSAVTPVMGSRLYGRGRRAAALLLDSLAVHHHPPSLLTCDEAVGAHCAGRGISFDPPG